MGPWQGQAFPPPPMGNGAFPGPAFGPGMHMMRPDAAGFHGMTGPAGLPQVEVKGQKLFLLQGPRLLVIDYVSGEIKTIDLREPLIPGKEAGK